MLNYAGMKFVHLISRHNPESSSYFKERSEDEILNLNESKYRIAFSIEDYNTPKRFKNDPKFVRWHFRLYGLKEREPFSITLPHHVCTKEDYE